MSRVTDQNGRLLNSGSQDSISSRSRKEFEIEQKREQEYMGKIDTILIPVVGLGQLHCASRYNHGLH